MVSSKCLQEWRPAFAMVGINVVIAVNNVIIKRVLDDGLNVLVMITYQQLVAGLVLAPVAFLAERKTRPRVTVEILVYFFISALLGASLVDYLFFTGLQYTSATFSCAFLNMSPVFTFLIAIPFRLERVNLKRKSGIAKVLGILACLVGAILLSFYKGVTLTNSSHKPTASEENEGFSLGGKWMLGTLALFGGCFCWSSWFLLQTKVTAKFPSLYSAASITFFFSFLQAAVLTLSTQKGLSIWALRGKTEILVVLYSGAITLGGGYMVMSWCVEKRGPVFTCAFTPLIQVMAAMIGVSFLHEQLYLGSLLGSISVIAGLYFLLWGKSKDAHSSAVNPSQKDEEIQEPHPVSTV